MDNRYPDQHATPRLPRHPTRRALIAGAAGLLLATSSAAGLFVEDAAARRVRKRHRNRNHNRSKENSISIPGEPGKPGEDGEP
jgi:hypothetical protein